MLLKNPNYCDTSKQSKGDYYGYHSKDIKKARVENFSLRFVHERAFCDMLNEQVKKAACLDDSECTMAMFRSKLNIFFLTLH